MDFGGMDIQGIGYSNIRLPNSNDSFLYTYNSYINTFPEEVFVHEFLHTLERILKERGYDIPELHDYKKYGYNDERLRGQKNWYRDYLRCNIQTTDGKIGLDDIVYTLTPPANSDFKQSIEKNFSNEPGNIIQEITDLLKNIGSLFKN